MAIEANTLPGNPPKALIAKVRRDLWFYVKSKPPKDDSLWRDVWYWAAACREKQNRWVTRPRRGQGWPAPHEIASQFLYIGLSEMKAGGNLKLPYHAKETITPRIMERMEWHARLNAARAEGIKKEETAHLNELKLLESMNDPHVAT